MRKQKMNVYNVEKSTRDFFKMQYYKVNSWA